MGKYGIICHIILKSWGFSSRFIYQARCWGHGINSWRGSTRGDQLRCGSLRCQLGYGRTRVYCNCSQWPGSYWTVQMYVKEHRRALSDWPESGPMLLTAEAAAAWPHSGSHNNTNQRTEQLGWLEAVTPVQLVTQITHKSTELVRSCTKRFCRELHRTCKG